MYANNFNTFEITNHRELMLSLLESLLMLRKNDVIFKISYPNTDDTYNAIANDVVKLSNPSTSSISRKQNVQLDCILLTLTSLSSDLVHHQAPTNSHI